MGKKHNNVQYTELPSEGFDKCVICGANTTGYAFCRKCFKKHEEAELLDILNKTAQPSPQLKTLTKKIIQHKIQPLLLNRTTQTIQL